MTYEYDYLIVGSGLFGAVFAHQANTRGKKCLVIDKRSHQGGNVYCKETDGINVHNYGAHIFHTNDLEIWKFVNRFSKFNNFINSPLANYKGKLYNLPFNMNTFYQLWGTKTPLEAERMIKSQLVGFKFSKAQNLEERAVQLVGPEIYEKFIKHYTAKQWGKSPTLLPASIINRIPVRYTFNNNYFDDIYQGIPIGGYNSIIEKLLSGADVRLNVDFFSNRETLKRKASKIIYTGKIDQFFDYRFGHLEYRSLRFEHETHDIDNYQGNAVINFTGNDVDYTRIIEHKHFQFGRQPTTVISKEYPLPASIHSEPYYPINDYQNNIIHQKYKELAINEDTVIFGGRLAEFKYYDMHQVIASALYKSNLELNRELSILK